VLHQVFRLIGPKDLSRDADVIAENAGPFGDRKSTLRVDPPCQELGDLTVGVRVAGRPNVGPEPDTAGRVVGVTPGVRIGRLNVASKSSRRLAGIALAAFRRLCYAPGMRPPTEPGRLRPLPLLIFSSRWLQLPLYLGLIVAQCVYVFLFVKELWHLVSHAANFSEQEIMLVVLGLIDVVMISNLLVMVIVGGYETFVSRLRLEGHPDQPEWLSHVNAGVLKVKLAMAIIGISSIHLLRTFIEAGAIGTPTSRVAADGVMWQTIIHSVFILSALGIVCVDRLSEAKR